MASLVDRLRGRTRPSFTQQQHQIPQVVAAVPAAPREPSSKKDANLPDYRNQIHQKCIYERSLPGDAYITAHVQRLQSGYYDSPSIQEDAFTNVRFVAVNFVFHPSRALSNRFKSAIIRISLLEDLEWPSINEAKQAIMRKGPAVRPRFLRHAPHLMYGTVSPESLQWNFSLAGSLGISQMPVSASLNPSGGLQASYKLYEMMRIQGSTRTLRSPYGPECDVEDGQIVWSLEENVLQRSGLPREFTFVMLLQKPPGCNLLFDLDIQPTISAWFGGYPGWWLRLPSYLPLYKEYIDLDGGIGKKFEPIDDQRGFNFADLASTFDELVVMPGTTYTTKEAIPAQDDHYHHTQSTTRKQDHTREGGPPATSGSGPLVTTNPSSPINSTSADAINVRVFFDRASLGLSPHPSPAASPARVRRRSLRRAQSREGLKEYGAMQNGPSPRNHDTPRLNRFSYPTYPANGNTRRPYV